MPYKVTVNNQYSDGSRLHEQFDTNSGSLHEAIKDARIEAFGIRWIRDGKQDLPFKESITCLSL